MPIEPKQNYMMLIDLAHKLKHIVIQHTTNILTSLHVKKMKLSVLERNVYFYDSQILTKLTNKLNHKTMPHFILKRGIILYG